MAAGGEQPAGAPDRTALLLSRALLAKSLAEMLFVCFAVSFTAFAYLRTCIRGEIQVADATHVQGWALDRLRSNHPLELQLFIDDQFFGTTTARDALPAASNSKAQGHAFIFQFETHPLPPGEHSVKVYALERASLQNFTLRSVTLRPQFFQVR